MDALTKPPASLNRRLEIAVLVPCLNEAAGIARVVESFRQALPDSRIYVYDNGSSDQTAAVALAAGAEVRTESLRGKGNVVRRMFADVEADVFVMVDGDGTYHAPSAPEMIELLVSRHLDMVCGKRVENDGGAYRSGHRLGNRVLTGLVATLFGNRVSDILSGYRVMSRRFVKSFPALSSGFETETELTVHALDLRAPVAEVATPYRSRAQGSVSKLNTFADGWRILRTIVRLVKEERPFAFFSSVAAFLATLAILLAIPLFITFFETGLVPRVPTAILCTGLILVAVSCFACGLILDTVTRGRRELKRMHYLSHPGVPQRRRSTDAPEGAGRP
ncbi:MAG TPA: glycosyltransferase [Steroidobacteraceae bacterium]|nr:glycosyltransferase [Steroidobacteraceae bacterium]